MPTSNGKLVLALLLGGTALVSAQAQAQETPPSDEPTVTGRRMPTAEAPRSATCEELARDPLFRAQINAAGGEPLMGPRAYLPTRMPRNPDYTRPPLVPAGSPLPELGQGRFGQRRLADGIGYSDPVESNLTESSTVIPGYDDAIADCRAAFLRGGGGRGSTGTGYTSAASTAGELRGSQVTLENGLGAANARFGQARAFISSRDQTLPMAFALFDQGRYAESLDWFRKAANKLQMREGGDEAMLFVGKLYLQGLGDRSDPQEALKWLKKVATAPYNPIIETPQFDPLQPESNTALGEAAVILANIYRNGFGSIAKDPAEARKWYARAYAVGHVPAAKILGDIHYEGIDTPRDVKKAMGYYSDAAKLNHSGAQVALGNILLNGEDGVPAKKLQALQWYQAAAKNNYPSALYALGRAYDLGDGVPADQQRAMALYKSAALGGNAAAKVSLGTYFYEGGQLPKDDAAARGWFEQAALQDDADGMFNLAVMLSKGEGGAKDLPQAWAWLRRAAQLGHANAPRALAALETKMTPDEKQAAAALVRGG